ncbi:hypothetical protein GCM10011578_080660 [Streptomyces fuscichromogenes]|uniref:Uncharacterized protein n=1 Tax=Streptomyces fuscichromogenes TaxID=1324013 RepID=A0A918CVY9_9ACTN|nr:hypothetical protein GCM10011578_080660 [Streptomyces fuscichromogenes]
MRAGRRRTPPPRRYGCSTYASRNGPRWARLPRPARRGCVTAAPSARGRRRTATWPAIATPLVCPAAERHPGPTLVNRDGTVHTVGLHPDAAGQARIAERFLPPVFGARGVFR